MQNFLFAQPNELLSNYSNTLIDKNLNQKLLIPKAIFISELRTRVKFKILNFDQAK